jgi:hypothetical protein
MNRSLVPIAFMLMLLAASPAAGQGQHPVADYASVPIESLADVILVIEPHATLALDLPTPAERIVQGSIVRVEKGVVPHTIVHTSRTIVAPLRAGVPAKLFLKAFKDRNAHYIIGVFPGWYGGKP